MKHHDRNRHVPGCTPDGQKAARRRVALACAGLGHVARGYERFFEELGPRLDGPFEISWFVGAAGDDPTRHAVACLRRTSRIGQFLTRFLGGHRVYTLEAASFGIALFPALLRRGCEVVFTADFHTARWLHILNRLLPGSKRIVILHHNGAPTSARRLAFADRVQQITEDVHAKALDAGLSQSRLLPIPVEPPAGSAAAARELRESLGIAAGHPLLLTVGAHYRFKGLDRVICALEALEALVPEENRPYLLIAGEKGPETRSLEELAQSHAPGRVHFRQFPAAAMGAVYRASTIAIVPSDPEGFGLSLVEAMASGVAVVANDDVRKRSLGRDGARFARAENVPELAATLAGLLQSETRRMELARRGRQVAREHFSFDQLLPRYVALLEETLDLADEYRGRR